MHHDFAPCLRILASSGSHPIRATKPPVSSKERTVIQPSIARRNPLHVRVLHDSPLLPARGQRARCWNLPTPTPLQEQSACCSTSVAGVLPFHFCRVQRMASKVVAIPFASLWHLSKPCTSRTRSQEHARAAKPQQALASITVTTSLPVLTILPLGNTYRSRRQSRQSESRPQAAVRAPLEHQALPLAPTPLAHQIIPARGNTRFAAKG